jgi:hypothetical protein
MVITVLHFELACLRKKIIHECRYGRLEGDVCLRAFIASESSKQNVVFANHHALLGGKMQFSLDCYPCAVRQALLAIRQTGMDETAQSAAMRRVLGELIDIHVGASAPEITMRMHALLREITGVEDLYHEQKAFSTREALSLYPSLKEKIQRSSDPFETALRLSIAGNIIDLARRTVSTWWPPSSACWISLSLWMTWKACELRSRNAGRSCSWPTTPGRQCLTACSSKPSANRLSTL